MRITDYNINKYTLVIDVGGDVRLPLNKNIKNIPVKFGRVDGWFYVCNSSNLESLIGYPDSSTGVYCDSMRIKNFNGLGYVKDVVARDIKSLKSFKGLPNELENLNISGSCHNVNSLDHFPKIINGSLVIGPDFKLFDSLYRNVEICNVVYLIDEIEKYGNILKLLHVKGLKIISSSNSLNSKIATDILTAEIRRQPDPRKRNLLKVAQELSNAGFHYLTI